MRLNRHRFSVGARYALLGVGVLGALAARWQALPYESGDYINHLGPWWNFIRDNGGFAALRHEFSNYNPPYLYLLAAGSYLDPWVRDLTVIKGIGFFFDLLLAFFVLLAVRLRYPPPSLLPAGAALAVLFAPWVFLNSAVWGQADSTYVAFLAGSLYFLLAGRRAWAFLFFGLAFSFKLQAIFFAPPLLWLLLKGEARWREALLSPLAFALSLLPAAWIGRPLSELLSIYPAQTNVSRALADTGPGLYHWFFISGEWAPLFVGAAAIALLLVTDFLVRSGRAIGERLTLLATFAALLAPWILPHIRERDYYPAETLSIVLAFFCPRYWFVPVTLSLIATIGYLQYLLWWGGSNPVPEHWLSLGVLSLIVALGRRVFRDFAVPNGNPAMRSLFRGPRALVWFSVVLAATASAAYGGHRALRHRAVEERIAAAGAPVVPAPWAVYWEEDGEERNLLYFREGCYTKTDRFVLHFYPQDAERLAPTRRRWGFSVLEFDFEERELMWGRNCLASVPLPDYTLSSVVTGQVRERDDRSPEFLWLAGFRPPDAGTAPPEGTTTPRFEGPIDPERYRTPLSALAAGEWGALIARSEFDIHLQGRELRYHREHCTRADLKMPVFLYIHYPSSDAAPAREPLNRDFDFYDYGVIEEGRCLAVVPLPEGRYTKLETGQWAGPNPWRAEGRLDRARYRTALRSLDQGERGEPDVRSVFDLYFGDGEILYYRESCSAADLEGRFALAFHPLAGVASGDEPLNRDFDFYAYGVIEDGSCLAIVPLPEGRYRKLETGQWGERRWRVVRRLDRDRYRAALAALDSGEWGEPDVREFFDLWWRENELRYVRKPCATEDTEARFYLHVHEARTSAVENRDFDFAEYGVILDDACLAIVPHAGGDLRRIATGQFISGGPRTWQAELWPAKWRSESLLESIAAGRRGPPTAQSTFDFYFIESALVFHRAPCSASDVEAQFFLHFYPEDAADLPMERRNYGFENRDFDFSDHGDLVAEVCLARVPLPDYAVSRIRTGQFRPGGAALWSVEVRPGSPERSP